MGKAVQLYKLQHPCDPPSYVLRQVHSRAAKNKCEKCNLHHSNTKKDHKQASSNTPEDECKITRLAFPEHKMRRLMPSSTSL